VVLGLEGNMRSLLMVLCILAAVTTASARKWDEEDFLDRRVVPFPFDPPSAETPRDQVRTVIGEQELYKPTKGDTFFDLARFFDLGYNEIVLANPKADEWLPDRGGEPIVAPTAWVLPCCTYEGIVINIPEMRLYYYPPRAKGAERRVITFPVGLGRIEWKTPKGKFKVREKTVDPTWVIPESIRKERIADKGFSEEVIPGGSPDNPLGKYRIRLSLDLYGIHGTNIPWGVGMSVSHGCVRLYPEDIEKLYPMIKVGAEGEFVYETVKVGLKNGDVWVEVHDDPYGLQPGPWRRAMELLTNEGLVDLVDEDLLLKTVSEARGYPVNVSRRASPDVVPVSDSTRAMDVQVSEGAFQREASPERDPTQ
jgi:L,D-transpeptidase ErfK/SrfK